MKFRVSNSLAEANVYRFLEGVKLEVAACELYLLYAPNSCIVDSTGPGVAKENRMLMKLFAGIRVEKGGHSGIILSPLLDRRIHEHT